MKRLLAALLIVCWSIAAEAATCTFSVTGSLWSAGGSCGVAPTTADDCVTNANIGVVMDSSAGVCGTLDNNGYLFYKEGDRTLTIGDAGGAKTDTFINDGWFSLGAGQKLLMSVSNPTPANGNGLITNNGVFSATGKIVTRGAVSSFTEPAGNVPSRTVTITSASIRQPFIDAYNGMYLIPTSGYFSWQWFAITTGATSVNDIIINIDSRGAVDTRNKTGRVNPTVWAAGDWGEIYATGTAAVTSGTTTVTFNTAFASVSAAQEKLLGSRFVCNADLDVVDDTDFRRFCSVTSTTVAELCSNYGTASCNTTAAYRVYDDNQPPGAAKIIESFSGGERFLIVDAAEISVPSGSDTTAPAANWSFTAGNGTTTRLYGVSMGHCGARLSGSNRNCMTVQQIDNDNTNEGFYADLFDLHHFNGSHGIDLFDSSDIEITRFSIRDAAEGGDSSAGNEAHSIQITDPAGNGRTERITLRNGRIMRGNDDAITMLTSGEADNVVCNACTFDGLYIGFTPTNVGGSIEGIETGATVSLPDFSITRSIVTNVNGSLINFPETSNVMVRGYIRDVILQNTQTAGLFVGQITGTAPTDANFQVTIINSVLRNTTRGSLPNIQRGRYYNSYINPIERNGASSSDAVSFASALHGNIIVGPGAPVTGSSNVIGLLTGSTTTQFLPGVVRYTDNAIFGTLDLPTTTITTRLARLGGSSGSPAIFFEHNLVVGAEHLLTTGNFRGVQTNGPIGVTHTIRSNVFHNMDLGLSDSDGAGTQTITTSHNLFSTVVTPEADTDIVLAATDLNTGVFLGLSDPSLLNGFVPQGSIAWSSLGHDGTVRGPRMAGPVLDRLLAIYPFLVDERDADKDGVSDTIVGQIPSFNTANAIDTDGDGIFDLFDNCPTRMNPVQGDADADGLGDACE